MKSSENKDAAFQFINFMLDAKNHAWAAQNIDYKVPNKPAMESLPADLPPSSRTWGCRWRELVKFEQLRDVGDAQRDYSRIGQRDQGGAVALPFQLALRLCMPIASGDALWSCRRLGGDVRRQGRTMTSSRSTLLMAPALAWLSG